VTSDTSTEHEEAERSPPYQESQDSSFADDGDGDGDGDGDDDGDGDGDGDDSLPSVGGNVATGVGIRFTGIHCTYIFCTHFFDYD
jgi:hypothetical protein